jgi:hypothetical protein
MSWCRCPTCQETFTCLSAFDMHRVGSFGDSIYAASRTGKSRQVIGHRQGRRRRLSEPEMLEKGMVRNDKGWWMTRPSVLHWTQHEETEEAETMPSS